MRLLPGILAGQIGEFVARRRRQHPPPADGAGRRRRCARWACAIETTDGLPPVTVARHRRRSSRSPTGCRWPRPRSSRAVLLAGLFAERGVTMVEEPVATRDHTERMLQRAGVPVDRRPGAVRSRRCASSCCREIAVPGDFSSAAPVHRRGHGAAGLEPDAARHRHQPDPHRPADGAGADGRAGGPVRPARWAAGEPVADIEVRPRRAGGHRGRARAGAGADRRAAAGGAAGQLRPRHDGDPRRRRAAGEGVRPDRDAWWTR